VDYWYYAKNGPILFYILVLHFLSLKNLAGNILSLCLQKRGNRIVGVMVRALDSSAVNRVLDPQSGQTKDYKGNNKITEHRAIF